MSKRNRHRHRSGPPAGIPPNPRFKKETQNGPKPKSFGEIFGPITESLKEGLLMLDPKTSETDSVIITASLLEQMLLFLITLKFRKVASQNEFDALFEYPGPLSSLSARINLCAILGLLPGDIRNNLDLVRSIRNDFCHSTKPRSFSDKSIIQKCNNFQINQTPPADQRDKLLTAMLTLYEKRFDDPARKKFTAATFTLIVSLFFIMLFAYEELRSMNENLPTIMKRVNQRSTEWIKQLVEQVSAKLQEIPANNPQ